MKHKNHTNKGKDETFWKQVSRLIETYSLSLTFVSYLQYNL